MRYLQALLDDVRKQKPTGEVLTKPTKPDITEGRTIALLIDSPIVGPVWFALRDGWRPDPGDSTPVFYASELPALREKTLEQLRTIFNVKTVFGGGKVLDTGKNCWNCGAEWSETKDIQGNTVRVCWSCARTA